jgi:hypothetical protein
MVSKPSSTHANKNARTSLSTGYAQGIAEEGQAKTKAAPLHRSAKNRKINPVLFDSNLHSG